MITVKYVAGYDGKEYVLNKDYEIAIQECNPHFTSWGYESTPQTYGIDITSFKKSALLLDLVFKFRGVESEIGQNLEAFFRSCEVDIINKTQGKLYFNDEYLSGYFIERETSASDEFYGYSQEATFIAPYPFYIKEISETFTAGGQIIGDYLDYKYDYNYDYTMITRGGATWDNGHYAPSDFKMKIYGAVQDPQIYVNGHLYKVYDELLDGEWLEIDSRDNTITKRNVAGLMENLYNNREKSVSVFQQMPAGRMTITWAATFNFDLTLYLERSEPTWN